MFLSCFVDTAKVVLFMVLRHTFQTHQLLVIYAEELMLQTMNVTENTLILCRNPASLLLHERLARTLKRQIFKRRTFCSMSAERAFLHQLLTPGALETLLAEAVTTTQNHWILKDFQTNRAFEVFFQISVRRRHDFFWFLVVRSISVCFLCYSLHVQRNETESVETVCRNCIWFANG